MEENLSTGTRTSQVSLLQPVPPPLFSWSRLSISVAVPTPPSSSELFLPPRRVIPTQSGWKSPSVSAKPDLERLGGQSACSTAPTLVRAQWVCVVTPVPIFSLGRTGEPLQNLLLMTPVDFRRKHTFPGGVLTRELLCWRPSPPSVWTCRGPCQSRGIPPNTRDHCPLTFRSQWG